jgi:murein DD-endopeptidase MepM/ murein hydrolase activator NlpD
MNYYNSKKIFVFILSGMVFYLIGKSYYMYYFDDMPPMMHFQGITHDGYYNGTISININAQDNYKIKYLSINLDEKTILSNYLVNSNKLDYPLLIPTIHLNNGPHSLTVNCIDGSYNKNSTTKKIDFHVDNDPLEIYIIEPGLAKVQQGNVLHVQLKSNKFIKNGNVKTLQYTLPIVLEAKNNTIYEAYIPISTEEIPGKYIANIYIEDAVKNTATFEYEYEIIPTNFKKQYIKLQAGKQEELDQDGEEDSENFKSILENVIHTSPAEKLWQGTFYRPCLGGPITTEFGVVRTSFEKGRYRHDAIDFGAAPKSPVWACQDGVIIIKGFNKKGYGNFVAIDHGIGLVSLYGHLHNFGNIEVGQSIKKGTIVGFVGMTGYATGYHLHWEIRLQNVKVNPLQWIKDDV